MRYILLLAIALLAGCTAHYVERTPAPYPRPGVESPTHAPAGAAQLVTGKNTSGHRDFANAKKILPTIYLGMERDFYCDCQYSGTKVNLASCGYVPRKNPIRAGRIEWEHVVPAWVLGHQRQCWKTGGRENCTDNDPVFRMAEGDLNNLVPAVGEVNGDRNNYAYSAWTRTPTPMYGRCETIIDFQLKKAQPREAVRGRAARITLYMESTYSLRLSSQDKKLMCAWAKTYPVDDWERERNVRIIRWQGRSNPFVTDTGLLKRTCG